MITKRKKFDSPGGEVYDGIESNLSKALRKISFEDIDADSIPDDNLNSFVRVYSDAVPSIDISCPWLDMFTLPKCFNLKLLDIIDVPLCHVPESVYEASVEWMNKNISDSQLDWFMFYWLKKILYELHMDIDDEESIFEEEVAEFIVYAMIARNRSAILIEMLPELREYPILNGAPNLIPVTVWTIAQASHHDLPLALYSWARNLLPLFSSCKDGSSQDLILALVENILWAPDAKNTLFKAVAPIWNEEHVIPLSSFKILLRLTFPDTSTRDTSRFESIYPDLKEVALANILPSPELFESCLRLSEQGNPALAEEAESIAMWCLTGNLDCWKQWKWDSLYKENLKASVSLHRKFLMEEWIPYSLQQPSQQFPKIMFEFSFGLARDGHRDLHPEAIEMGIWSLNEIFDCCKLYDHLHELNLKDIVNLLSALRGGSHNHHHLNEAIPVIFSLSLKLAKEEEVIGNHATTEVQSVALWCLSVNSDCFSLSLF